MVIIKKGLYGGKHSQQYIVDGFKMGVIKRGSDVVIGCAYIKNKKVFLRKAGQLLRKLAPKNATYKLVSYDTLAQSDEKKVRFRFTGFKQRRR